MKPFHLAVAILFATIAIAQPQSSAPKREPPKGMKNYFLAFLLKGERRDQPRTKEELEQLQQQHLGYIRAQGDAGRYAVAGPLLDDGRIRGIVVISADSAEQAKNIVDGDPAVKAGRLTTEIHPIMLADLSCVLPEYKKNSAK